MGRPSRKYSKRIEVWLNAVVQDGFGGNNLSESKLQDVWCEIRTIPIDKLVDFGLDVQSTSISIYLRRDTIDYYQKGLFFRYSGKSYMVNRINENDIDGVEIKIIATHHA